MPFLPKGIEIFQPKVIQDIEQKDHDLKFSVERWHCFYFSLLLKRQIIFIVKLHKLFMKLLLTEYVVYKIHCVLLSVLPKTCQMTIISYIVHIHNNYVQTSTLILRISKVQRKTILWSEEFGFISLSFWKDHCFGIMYF